MLPQADAQLESDSLSSKVGEELIIAQNGVVVCSPVTHSSVHFPVLVLVLCLLRFMKDEHPLVAVCLHSSGAQHLDIETLLCKKTLSS